MSVGSLVTSGPLILAVPVAAAAGAVTFLSPCCLPLVPGYLSYVTGMTGTAADAPSPAGATPGVPAETPADIAAGGGGAHGGGAVAVTAAPVRVRPQPRSRVMLGTLLFVLGFSVLYAFEGVMVSSVGDALQVHAHVLTKILGVVIILLGLMFLGAFDRFSFAGRIFRPTYRPRVGLAGAPLLGVMFGLGWTPCTGPTLSAVLALGGQSGTALRGGLLAFVYAMGLGIPFLIVAFAFQRGVTIFGWARRHGRLITVIGGLMLITVGVLEITGAWANAITWLQVHWLSGYTTPF
jgi:cytochrome c-type biogenesis protein